MSVARFDFDGFRRAFVMQDIAAWAACFRENAQWLEYRHTNPPRSPRILEGRAAIEAHLQKVKASNVTLAIEDEVIGPERAAFRVWVDLPDGRRIVEQVIIEIEDGLIARQVDVEAWD
jgi:ketosteroid isomerase-like protein